MSSEKVIISNYILEDVADAIREMLSEDSTYKPVQFADKIRMIGGGSSVYTLKNLQRHFRLGSSSTFKIVCVGDSITYGYNGNVTGNRVEESKRYPYILNTVLHNFYDFGEDTSASGYYPEFIVSDVSMYGEGSDYLLNNKDTILGQNPDLIILELGVNDQKDGINSDETCANLIESIKWCKSNDIDVVLMNALPVWSDSNTDLARARHELNINYELIAKSQGVHLIDINKVFNGLFGSARYIQDIIQSDKAHLTDYRYLAYAVSDQLFELPIRLDSPVIQYHKCAYSEKINYSNGNVTGSYSANPSSATKTSFDRCVRIGANSEFVFSTYGDVPYNVGLLVSQNKYGGTLTIDCDAGGEHAYRTVDITYSAGVEVYNSTETIIWLPQEMVGLYHRITVSVSEGYSGQTTPYGYISAVVLKPKDNNLVTSS